MIDRSLFDYFATHHLPRGEVLNRLPLSISIEEFWPALQEHRKARALQVPLSGLDGKDLWFVMTDSIIASGDRISSMARRDIDSIEPGTDVITDGLLDEAFFTSYVEGAPVSRLESRRFLKSGGDPSNVGELLMQNNLSAIRYLSEHRYEPYSPYMFQKTALLLTSAMNQEVEDYRVSNEHRVPGRNSTASRVPPAAQIPRMMDSLCEYLNEYEMHPLLKAAIAQAAILMIRPFDEGNERLARLLSYIILLRNGYAFFRQFALSGMIAQDGMLYYKAMETIQDARGDGDLTCFLEYYLGMLSRSVAGFEAYIAQKRRNEMEKKAPDESNEPNQVIEVQPVNKQIDMPALLRENNPALPASPNKQKDCLVGIDMCTTAEMMVTYISKQQSKHLGIIDAKPYLDRLGINEEKILRALQSSTKDFSQRALSILRMLRSNPARKFVCSGIAQTMNIKNGTVRRICYVLASLNLIQATQLCKPGKSHYIVHFFYDEALAA